MNADGRQARKRDVRGRFAPTYEFPPWPSCPSCDGTGFYSVLDDQGELADRRCQCWVWELALNGPPETGIPPEAMW